MHATKPSWYSDAIFRSIPTTVVADSLEAEWNNKLRALATAQEDCERLLAGCVSVLSSEQRLAGAWRRVGSAQEER